jgi:hypothetical protein
MFDSLGVTGLTSTLGNRLTRIKALKLDRPHWGGRCTAVWFGWTRFNKPPLVVRFTGSFAFFQVDVRFSNPESQRTYRKNPRL